MCCNDLWNLSNDLKINHPLCPRPFDKHNPPVTVKSFLPQTQPPDTWMLPTFPRETFPPVSPGEDKTVLYNCPDDPTDTDKYFLPLTLCSFSAPIFPSLQLPVLWDAGRAEMWTDEPKKMKESDEIRTFVLLDPMANLCSSG